MSREEEVGERNVKAVSYVFLFIFMFKNVNYHLLVIIIILFRSPIYPFSVCAMNMNRPTIKPSITEGLVG